MALWSDEQKKKAVDRGRTLVTTNTPKTVAKLAFSLIGNNFTITTPTYKSDIPGVDEGANSQARASFLSALWRCWRTVGQKDVYFDLVFNQIVRGLSALQVAWIAKENVSDPWRPPVLFRALNPKNVGYLHDDVNLVVAYHTYSESIRKLKLRYPDITKLETIRNKDKAEVVTFTDFWYRDPNTLTVYNCYLINNTEILRPMRESKSPIIPIVIRAAQEYPMDKKENRIDTFISDIIPEWQIESKLESMMLSGIEESFWPAKYVRNRNMEPVGDLYTGQGAVNEVDPTFEFVDEPMNQRMPDFGNANVVSQRTHDRIQRSTFNDALFGLTDANARSSIMLHRMTQAGMSSLGAVVQAVGRSMMEANSIALCMLKKFSLPQGEQIYAYDSDNNEMVGYGLTPDQVHDSYENHVVIKPASSLTDDMQKLSVSVQLVVNDILSRKTVRENLVPFSIPSDEEDRINSEKIQRDPNVMAAIAREAYRLQTGQELPEGEPDWKDTPPAQPTPPQGIQPPQGIPGTNLPPEMQGQVPPEMMTGDANVDPQMLQMMMGRNIDPRQAMMR